MDKNKMIIGVVVLVAVGLVIWKMQGGTTAAKDCATEPDCTKTP